MELPRLQVKQYSRRKIETRYVSRVVTMKENESTELIVPPEEEEHLDELPIDPGDAEESLYHMKREVFHRAWEKIRDSLRDTTVRENCLPENASCISCIDTALIRCLNCGPRVFYCNSCYQIFHSKRNLFHIPEVWEVSIIHVTAWYTIDLLLMYFLLEYLTLGKYV